MVRYFTKDIGEISRVLGMQVLRNREEGTMLGLFSIDITWRSAILLALQGQSPPTNVETTAKRVSDQGVSGIRRRTTIFRATSDTIRHLLRGQPAAKSVSQTLDPSHGSSEESPEISQNVSRHCNHVQEMQIRAGGIRWCVICCRPRYSKVYIWINLQDGRSAGLFCNRVNLDNKLMILLAGNKTFSGRTKYTALRYQLLKELMEDGRINICHKGTTNMLADVLTKYLRKQAFENILKQIRNFEGMERYE